MPIRPEHRHFYPIDWPELSRAIRFGRAKGCCEHCGRPHGRTVAQLPGGRWFDEEAGRWRDKRGRFLRVRHPTPILDAVPADEKAEYTLVQVQLACAHLDQDTANNAAQNLAALCQRCHLDHDRPWNLQKRRITVLLRRALGDLFTGPYRR